MKDFTLLQETKNKYFYIGETAYNKALEKAKYNLEEYSITTNSHSSEGYTVINFMYFKVEDGEKYFDSFNLYQVPFKLIKKKESGINA